MNPLHVVPQEFNSSSKFHGISNPCTKFHGISNPVGLYTTISLPHLK
jgi:hypothetical protein